MGPSRPNSLSEWSGALTARDQGSSHRNYLYDVLDPGQVPRVAGVEPGRMRVSCSSDEEVHDAGSRLTASGRHGRSELAVAGGHDFVDGQRIELPLKFRKSPETLSTDCRVSGDEDTKMQFRERRRTDGQLAGQGREISGEQDAGVQDCLQRELSQGLATI